MIRGVALDMDGTMFDSEPQAIRAFAQVLETQGYEFPTSLGHTFGGRDPSTIRPLFNAHYGGTPDFDAVYKASLPLWVEYVEREGLPLMPGLVTLLDYLEQTGRKIAIATSGETVRVEQYLRISGLGHRFHAVAHRSMVQNGKPAPDIFLKAAELMGLPPQACLAVEDSPVGIEAALRAGMQAAMVPCTLPPEKAVSPYYVCAQLDHITQILDRVG